MHVDHVVQRMNEEARHNRIRIFVCGSLNGFRPDQFLQFLRARDGLLHVALLDACDALYRRSRFTQPGDLGALGFGQEQCAYVRADRVGLLQHGCQRLQRQFAASFMASVTKTPSSPRMRPPSRQPDFIPSATHAVSPTARNGSRLLPATQEAIRRRRLRNRAQSGRMSSGSLASEISPIQRVNACEAVGSACQSGRFHSDSVVDRPDGTFSQARIRCSAVVVANTCIARAIIPIQPV